MIKYTLLLLFVCGLYHNFSTKGCHSSDSTEIKEITIHYVNQSIETIYSVSCDNFEQFFGKKNYKEKKITERDQLKKFSNYLNKYQKGLSKNIDVRAKIYIYYSNKTKSVFCIDKFGNAMVNNHYVGINSKIIAFLQDSCEGFK